jgi:hypothetical protein
MEWVTAIVVEPTMVIRLQAGDTDSLALFVRESCFDFIAAVIVQIMP